MSDASIRQIKEALQAHIDEQREEGDSSEFLLEFAIGYAVMVQDEERERFSYRYITDPHSTPHSSVGLFAMASGQLDLDLNPE